MSERFLSRSTKPLRFEYLDNQKTWFHPDLISKMNDEADLLLLGGGGYVFHRPEDSSHSGWQFNIRLEDIEKIKVPIVFYAIGYNKFPFDNDGFRDILNSHLRACQDKSSLFSVRNNGTREELISRGLSGDKIEVIPDPAMFLTPRMPTLPGLDGDELAIGLNWAGDRTSHRWGDGGEVTELKTLRGIARGLARLLETKPGKVMLTPHIVDMDEIREDVLREELGDRLLNLMTEVPGMYPPATAQVNFLAGAYQRMDLVLGMRGHSNIIPFGMGTPTIAVGHHQKNRFFQCEIGQPDLVLDTERTELLENPNALASFIDEVLEKQDLREELATRRAELDALATNFDCRMLQLIDAV